MDATTHLISYVLNFEVAILEHFVLHSPNKQIKAFKKKKKTPTLADGSKTMHFGEERELPGFIELYTKV